MRTHYKNENRGWQIRVVAGLFVGTSLAGLIKRPFKKLEIPMNSMDYPSGKWKDKMSIPH